MNKERWKIRLIPIGEKRYYWQCEFRHALIESQPYADKYCAQNGWKSFARTHEISNWEWWL